MLGTVNVGDSFEMLVTDFTLKKSPTLSDQHEIVTNITVTETLGPFDGNSEIL